MSKLPLAALLAAFAPLCAQTAPGDFMAERIITLNNVFAPAAPNLPDAVLAGLRSGAIELRQRFTYNSAQRTMEQLAFIVPAKSPLPFPDPSSAPVGDHYIIQIESASISTAPSPAVILAGHITSNDVPTPFGYNTGAGVTLSFGYRSEGAAVQFGPIVESVSPLYGLYSDTGAGSLSLTPSSQKCTLGSLNGVYMFQLSGSIQNANGGFEPWVDSGRFSSDGNGSITIVDSGNIVGKSFINRTFPATYVMDENCAGTLTFGGSSMDVVVSHDGKTVNMVFTKIASVVASGVGRLQ